MRRSQNNLERAFAVIGIVGALIAVFALNMLVGLARQSDEDERSYESELVQQGVAYRVGEVEKELTPHFIWDEAVQNLDNRFDADWTVKNVGLPIVHGYGYKFVFILSDADQVLYGTENYKQVPAAAFGPLQAGTAPLMAKLRAAERAWQDRQDIPPPIQASQVAMIRDEPMLLTASLVAPDFKATLRGPTAPVLITGIPVSKAFVNGLQKRYSLQGLAVVSKPAPGLGFAKLPTNSDQQLYLEWRPRAPGSALLEAVLPPLLVLLLMLAVIFALLFRASRTAVAKLVEGEADATRRALQDPLTGIGNRSFLSQSLDHAKAGLMDGHSYCVVLIDLDHFKAINDTWGHDVGDEVIVCAGDLIRSTFEPSARVARLGGDEFAVVLPAADLGSAGQAVASLLAHNGNMQTTTAGDVRLSFTIGAVVVRDGNLTASEALRRADRALYEAKAAGRGRAAFYDERSLTQEKEIVSIREELRSASTDGRLSLQYQPIVDRDGKITRLEALARWHHPQFGNRSPAEFIGIAEEDGILPALGEEIIRTVILESRAWPELGVAINLTRRQTTDPELPSVLRRFITDYRIRPERFTFEVSEPALDTASDDLAIAIAAVRSLGFRVAISHLGTGRSSLSFFAEVQVDELKVARSITARLENDDVARRTANLLGRLAMSLNLTAVIEGVETLTQYRIARTLPFTEMQGFFFGRPVSGAQIVENMKAGSRADFLNRAILENSPLE